MSEEVQDLVCRVRKRVQLEDALLGAFMSSDNMKIIINTDGEILKVNKKWEEVLLYTADEMEGHYFWEFIDDEEVDVSKNLFFSRKQNSTGNTNKHSQPYYDITYINKEGKSVILRWTSDCEDFRGTLIASCVPV